MNHVTLYFLLLLFQLDDMSYFQGRSSLVAEKLTLTLDAFVNDLAHFLCDLGKIIRKILCKFKLVSQPMKDGPMVIRFPIHRIRSTRWQRTKDKPQGSL